MIWASYFSGFQGSHLKQELEPNSLYGALSADRQSEVLICLCGKAGGTLTDISFRYFLILVPRLASQDIFFLCLAHLFLSQGLMKPKLISHVYPECFIISFPSLLSH